MKASLRSLMCLLTVFVLALAVGCQSAAPPSASPMARRAVISTGQGSTVVYIPTSDGKGVERLASSTDAKECDQCKMDAEHYFLTGELSPVCTKCGAVRSGLTGPPPTIGHQ